MIEIAFRQSWRPTDSGGWTERTRCVFTGNVVAVETGVIYFDYTGKRSEFLFSNFELSANALIWPVPECGLFRDFGSKSISRKTHSTNYYFSSWSGAGDFRWARGGGESPRRPCGRNARTNVPAVCCLHWSRTQTFLPRRVVRCELDSLVCPTFTQNNSPKTLRPRQQRVNFTCRAKSITMIVSPNG